MIRYPIKNGPYGVTVSGTRFDHEVFFALSHRHQSLAVQKADSPVQLIFGSDRFMSEIETKTAVPQSRDHPGDDQRGRPERLGRELITIAFVPIDKSAGAALDVAFAGRMDGKSRRTSCYDRQQRTARQ